MKKPDFGIFVQKGLWWHWILNQFNSVLDLPVDEHDFPICTRSWSKKQPSKRIKSPPKNLYEWHWRTRVCLQDLQSVWKSWWSSTSFGPATSNTHWAWANHRVHRIQCQREHLPPRSAFWGARLWNCSVRIYARIQSWWWQFPTRW